MPEHLSLTPGQDDTDAPQWSVRWHDYLPAAALVTVMLLAWLSHLRAGMDSWGISAAVLARGGYENILLHVFAHGGWSHILMNSAALLEIGGIVVARLGTRPQSWIRFVAVFGLSALSSVVLFLSFHPQNARPMIGASGAIYGLVGLLLFILLSEEIDTVPLRQMPRAAANFLRRNVFFLVLLLISAALAGLSGGVAWEAHLGGFLFGFCVGPWMVPVLRVPEPS